jgi:hypothetical protein
MNNIYVIGAGGVGSFLIPVLAKLTPPENIIVIDGDTLEEKNMDRQLYRDQDIGMNKAEAIVERYGLSHHMDTWFVDGLIELDEDDWLMVCVDNHAARFSALMSCDRFGCRAIFAANEQWSSEAYYYQRSWKDSAIDPRTYFPDIVTDRSNDPRRAAIGCTGEAQKENVQLVTANAQAAALAGQMFALWHIAMPKMEKRVIQHLPYRRVINKTKMEEFKVSDINKTKEKGQDYADRPTSGGDGVASNTPASANA